MEAPADLWPELVGIDPKTKTVKCQGYDENHPKRSWLDERLFLLSETRLLEIKRIGLRRLESEHKRGGLKNLVKLLDLSLADNLLGPRLQPENELLHLSQLRSLDLSGNGLELVPNAVVALTCLESLDISRNELTVLPLETLAMAMQLRRLNASENRIESLGSGDVGPKRLQSLRLRRNALRHLKVVCPELRELDVGENLLSEISDEIITDWCPKLTKIDIDGNDLTDRKLVKAANPKKVLDLLRKGKSKAQLKRARHQNLPKAPRCFEATEKRVVLASRAAIAARPRMIAFIIHVTGDDYVFANNVDQSTFESLVGLDESLGDADPSLASAKAKLEAFLKAQTSLQASLGDKRRSGAIGAHALESLKWPLRYEAEEDPTFSPLAIGWMREKGRTTARSLASDVLQTSSSQQLKVAARLVLDTPVLAHLVDDTGIVLSVPPLSNSYETRCTLDTKNAVFVEISAENDAKDDAVLRAIGLELIRHSIEIFERSDPTVQRAVLVEPLQVVCAFDRSLVTSKFPTRDELLTLPPLPGLERDVAPDDDDTYNADSSS